MIWNIKVICVFIPPIKIIQNGCEKYVIWLSALTDCDKLSIEYQIHLQVCIKYRSDISKSDRDSFIISKMYGMATAEILKNS